VSISSAFDKTMAKVRLAELALRGAGGEPVDLRRTIASHGVADLPPNRIDEEAWTLDVTLLLGGKATTVRVSAGRKGHAKAEVVAGRADAAQVRRAVAHVLRLDEDLSPFYAVAATDPDLAWVTSGAGRMLRSPTVFEEVVKTICTTNCTWSATVRMVSALVEHLGEPALGATDGPLGHAFPTPEAMARKTVRFTLKLSKRAIGARTCGAWLDRSRPEKSISKRSATQARPSSRTTSSRRNCSRSRASARTRRRTS
jgi:3-methyladenine DNA glycosylase/8-oxoguanine DNA glycosylase